MAYPMEISRTWKFPWVKPDATHGNFQGLEISMTWKIPGPDTHLPLQNFFDGEYFAMNFFLQRHLSQFLKVRNCMGIHSHAPKLHAKFALVM